MNILLFGATGIIGDGVLRLLTTTTKISNVIATSHSALSVQHSKLEAVITRLRKRIRGKGGPASKRRTETALFEIGFSNPYVMPRGYPADACLHERHTI